MVKIHCDRCGAEIKDKYYTVNIYGYDTNPKYDYYATADCASASSNARDDILKTLNATKMYCKDCRDKIEAFINNA
jgi:hypothetical protein